MTTTKDGKETNCIGAKSSDQQQHAFEDYIEASLMLQYNKI